MKEGWEAKKLVDICKIQYGYPFDSKQFCDDSKYPQLIRIRDVSRGYSETYFSGEIPEGYYIDKGDYLIGMDGEFNIAAWNSERALLNQRVCKITANNEAFDRFLYYNLRIILKQIEDETPFVTVKHLSAKRLNGVTINLPPLSEQQHIVEELDLLSSIIEKKKAQLNELDNLAQSFFYEMFGDPITNEKGWEVKKLKDCCRNYDSQRKPITAKDRIKGSIPYYGASGIVDFVKDYIFEGDYLLVSEDGANLVLRNTPIAFCIKGKTWVNNHAHVLKFETLFQQKYVEFSINLRDISMMVTGCAQPKLTQAALNNMVIPYPPFDLQQQFSSKANAIEHQKMLIKQSIKEVETLFNSRMDYYFN